MPKTKSKPNEVVTFEIVVKGRKPMYITADAWGFESYSSPTAAWFMLDGNMMLAVPAGKWDYIRRVESKVKEDNDGKKQGSS